MASTTERSLSSRFDEIRRLSATINQSNLEGKCSGFFNITYGILIKLRSSL